MVVVVVVEEEEEEEARRCSPWGWGGGNAGLANRDMTYAEKQELTELLGELRRQTGPRGTDRRGQQDMGGDGKDLIEINTGTGLGDVVEA